MRFSVTDTLDCSPDRLREIVDGEAFGQRFEEETETRRELLEEQRDEGVERRSLRFVSLREIPAVMQNALGVERLEYQREERVDPDEGIVEWTVTTPFMPDRIEASGTTRLEATDEGCRRTVEGRVDIDLPLVGSKMADKFGQRLREAEVVTARIVREIVQ